MGPLLRQLCRPPPTTVITRSSCASEPSNRSAKFGFGESSGWAHCVWNFQRLVRNRQQPNRCVIVAADLGRAERSRARAHR